MTDETEQLLGDLQRPLDEISERKFREIVALLEQGREQPAVQRILDRARPRLRRIRPPRKLSLRRLFHYPAEDLLDSSEIIAGSGRIGRPTMQIAWDFVVERGDTDEWSDFHARFLDIGDSLHEALEFGKEFWPWAGSVLGDAVKLAATDRSVRRRLVGDHPELMPELQRVALLLQLGEPIQRIKHELPPKPIRTLTADHLLAVRDVVKNNAGDDVERATLLLQTVSARMAVPAELIQHVMTMSMGLARQEQHALIEQLQDGALAEIDRAARAVDESETDDALSRADLAKDLVMAIAAIQDGAKVEGRARRELTRLRANAERVVAGVVDDAGAKVTEAVGVGPSAPIEAQIETENNLLALRKCQGLAPALGLEGKVTDTLGGITKTVRQKAARLFSEIARLDGVTLDAGSPESEIYWAVRMLELAGNADEADKLRRDGMEMIAKQKRKVAGK